MIPLLHDFGGETVLVFGGGPVGARKARTFAREARVVVVSPAFGAAAYGGADLIRAAPTAADVEGWLDRVGPALVVAATDDAALNREIAERTRRRGILVNRADVAGERPPGSVALPAIARDGDVVVGVGTGGTSPALAAALRDRLATELEGAGRMAELTAALRADLADRGVDPADRRAALRAVLDDREVWTALDTGTSNARQLADDVISDVMGETS